MNEQEKQVSEFLESIGITFECEYSGQTFKEDWNGQKVNKYIVSFVDNSPMKRYDFDFFQGLGCKDEPTAASVLYCLLNDIQVGEMGWQEYVSEFIGGDPYSITVDEKIKIQLLIEDCEIIKSKVESFLHSPSIEYIRELLEDY